MARVLYTGVVGATHGETRRAEPGFVEAASLAEAEAKLRQRGLVDVRFWSHPFFGDAPGTTPEEAWAMAPRPRRWPGKIALALMIPVLPGSITLVVAAALESFGIDLLPTPALRTLVGSSVVASLFLAVPAFSAMRGALADREYRLATALLWALRLSFLPFWPMFTLWSVRARAGRLGPDAAMRPYRWLAAVGLTGVYDALYEQALDQLGLVDERIARLEARLSAGSMNVETDLALCRVLYRGDADGAAAALDMRPDEAVPPIARAFRQMIRAFVAVERRDPSAGSLLARARLAISAAAPTASLASLFDSQMARALAQGGEREAAEALLRRAAGRLLVQGEHIVLDRAAKDVATAGRP